MLVITRKINESASIGNNIKIKIVKIKSNAVQIGIEAPGTISIKRDGEQKKSCKDGGK